MAKFEEGDPRWIVADRSDGKNVNAWHWEEKDMTAWAKQRVEELLKDSVVHEGDDCKVTVVACDKFSGDVALHQRKARRFFTYQLDIRTSFTVDFKDGEKAVQGKGEVELPDAGNDENMKDWDVKINVTQGEKSLRPRIELLGRVYALGAVKSAMQKIGDELNEMIRTSEVAKEPVKKEAPKPSEVQRASPAPLSGGVKVAELAKQAKGVETKTLKLEEKFDCRPEDLYSALLDPPRIGAYTQAPARMEKTEGGSFEMLGGSITGVNVELKENEKIVQRWRMKYWPLGHESLLTLQLTSVADGARLNLTQAGVPVDEAPRVEYGWRVQFFQRMKMMFGY